MTTTKTHAKKSASEYTEAMVAYLETVYPAKKAEGENNEVLAEMVAEFNKKFGDEKTVTVNAVRQKLVSLGIYEKDAPRAVGGASGVRKLSIVRTIEAALGLEKGSLDSFEKASKSELEKLSQALSEKAEA